MFLQSTFLLLGCLSIDVALVCHQRHLGVYDHVLSLWIVQDDIRLHLAPGIVILHRTSLLVAQTGLHLIVYALGQTLGCKQVAQDDFAHIATDLVVTTQYVSQSLGFLTHFASRFHHQSQLFFQ